MVDKVQNTIRRDLLWYYCGMCVWAVIGLFAINGLALGFREAYVSYILYNA